MGVVARDLHNLHLDRDLFQQSPAGWNLLSLLPICRNHLPPSVFQHFSAPLQRFSLGLDFRSIDETNGARRIGAAVGYRNGLTAFTVSYVCPWSRSSESTVEQPSERAASRIDASQKEI
jgi:hypothetical protein